MSVDGVLIFDAIYRDKDHENDYHCFSWQHPLMNLESKCSLSLLLFFPSFPICVFCFNTFPHSIIAQHHLT